MSEDLHDLFDRASGPLQRLGAGGGFGQLDPG